MYSIYVSIMIILSNDSLIYDQSGYENVIRELYLKFRCIQI